MMKKLNLSQKVLLLILYGLIILMVIFSLGATKNIGKSSYDQCIQEKCEKKGDDYCHKYREINNCCLGAGGQIAQSNDGLICVFD